MVIGFLGGGIGSVGRFALSIAFKDFAVAFPWPTLLANVFATVVIGVIYFCVKSQPSSVLLLFATGFCGRLNTFSAIILETFQLLK